MIKSSRNIVVILRNLLILLAIAIICVLAIVKVSDQINVSVPSEDYGFKKKSWVGQYLSGYHATQIHDYEKASEFFAQSVNMEKSSEYTLTQTMNLLIVTGKFKEAFEIADYLYKNNQNILAAIVKTIKEVERGNYKAADIIANQLSKRKESATVLNQVIYAWIKFGNSNYLAAKNIFESMQKEKRFLPLINYHYAMMADLAGDKKKARELYLSLSKIENPPVGIAAASYNFFVNNKDPKTAEIIAQHYGKARIQHLKEYHKVTNSKQGISEGLADTATIIMTEYKDDSAATFFRLALFLEPNFDEVKLLLATILMNQGDHEGANKLLKSISDKSSVYEMSKLAVAKNYEEMKQDAKARQYYEKLAENDATKLEALINLADLRREAEQYEEAAEYYTEALEFGKLQTQKMGNDDLDSVFWAIYFARGVCYERLGKWEKAEADLKQALELSPEQPDVLNYLGYSWIESGKNIEEGIKMVSRAYELKPEDSHILDSVGWGWYKLGEYENALKFLEAAITEMPYDATVNDHLGDTYWRLGRRTEARYQWRRALENDPEKKYIAALKDKLENGLPEDKVQSKLGTAISEDINPIDQAEVNAEPEEMEGAPE